MREAGRAHEWYRLYLLEHEHLPRVPGAGAQARGSYDIDGQ